MFKSNPAPGKPNHSFFEKLKLVPMQRLPLLIHTLSLKKLPALQIVFLLFTSIVQYIKNCYLKEKNKKE